MNEGNDKQVGFSTIGLIRDWFPSIFALMFWLNIIVATIGGAVVAHGISAIINNNRADEIFCAILGGIIGLIVGFLVSILANGIVATLLKMDENLQYLVDKEKAKV